MRAFAFEIDERRFRFVERGVLLGELAFELVERVLLGLEFGLFGGEDGVDLVELGVEARQFLLLNADFFLGAGDFALVVRR